MRQIGLFLALWLGIAQSRRPVIPLWRGLRAAMPCEDGRPLDGLRLVAKDFAQRRLLRLISF